ncbi:MAG: 50S ribosomal protein L24 [Candidatus Absconditabacterales bacterium]
MQKIKTGDMVLVTTGQYKGKTAKVLRVSEDGVYLEGLNIKKRSKKGQGYVDVHHAINYSNVAYWDGEKSSRVGFTIEDGKKFRTLKTTKTVLK